MKTYLKPVLLASLVGLSLAAGAAVLKTDPAKTSVSATFKQMNVPVESKFKKHNVLIDYDAAKPDASKATVEVETASLDMGDPEYNKEVAKKEWFNSAQFPKTTFVSTAIKSAGAGKLNVTGTPTIKVNGKTTVEYTEPEGVQRPADMAARRISKGTFAFQGGRYPSISRILVSTQASVDNGRRNWGIPKDRCDFRVEYGPQEDHIALTAEDGTCFAELTFRPRRMFRLPTTTSLVPRKLRTLGQHRNGQQFLYAPQSKGHIKPAQLVSARFDPAYYPDISRGTVACASSSTATPSTLIGVTVR